MEGLSDERIIDKFNLDRYVIIDLDDGEVDFSLIINDIDNQKCPVKKLINSTGYLVWAIASVFIELQGA